VTGSTPARVNAVLLAALLFAQLFLMAGSLRGNEAAALIESGARGGTGPLLGVAATVSRAVSGSLGLFGEIRRSREERSELRREVARLTVEIEGYREQALENERLRRLLGMRSQLAPRSVGASVVAASLSGPSRVLVVDAGGASDVRTDMPAVAWGGAVGRVIAAGRAYAKVRLLTDPWSRVAGVVQRSRVEGVVAGRGDRFLEMAYVPNYADVVVGDRVVTSGLDGVFPRGFGIGRVTSVGEPNGVSKAVEIAPEVDFARLEELLVLIPSASASEAADLLERQP